MKYLLSKMLYDLGIRISRQKEYPLLFSFIIKAAIKMSIGTTNFPRVRRRVLRVRGKFNYGILTGLIVENPALEHKGICGKYLDES